MPRRTRACARASARVDPAGGGTDAPPFSVDHGGLVINFGVDLHAYASFERLPRGHGVVVASLDLDRAVVAPSSASLPVRGELEFLSAFVRRLVPPEDSIALVTDSDIPAGSGLGGSGAVGVAIVAAIDRGYGRTRSRVDTALLANHVERVDLGYPGGNQDSFGAALGGLNRLVYRRGGETEAQRIAVALDVRRELEHASILVYTGAARVSGSIHEDIKRSYGEPGSSTPSTLRNLRDDAEALAAALEAGDLDAYVGALNASCRHLYELHPSCDSAAHRELFADLGDRILGAKTCGAGGGGFALVHTRAGRRRDCVRRAEALGAKVWPLEIDFDGLVEWDEVPYGEEQIERFRALARG